MRVIYIYKEELRVGMYVFSAQTPEPIELFVPTLCTNTINPLKQLCNSLPTGVTSLKILKTSIWNNAKKQFIIFLVLLPVSKQNNDGMCNCIKV